MNYGKKDEDAELGLIKVDRTQVFQEGELPIVSPFRTALVVSSCVRLGR